MLHIVLPVHNRRLITTAFVSRLLAQTFDNWTLLLVDDGCSDDTAAAVRTLVPANQLTVLTGDGSLWWAGALQMAYDYLSRSGGESSDAVLLINDDVTFEVDFLEQGMALLHSQTDTAFQALGVDKYGGKTDAGVIVDFNRLTFRATTADEQPNCLATRGLIMTLSAFRLSGGFRPQRLPHYLSDYEFSIRLNRNGVKLACNSHFHLIVDSSLSGQLVLSSSSPMKFLRESFSNRFMLNPMHWSAFALLVCNPSVATYHVARIWTRFLWGFARNSIRAGISQLASSFRLDAFK
jgi:GT2 family glycosyltransferase